MAYPFYRALKLAYPGDEIHFLAPETLASFSDQEFCSKKLIQNKSAKRFGPSFLQMVSELKKENYDFVVSLTASPSSSILFWLTRIPVRVGFGQHVGADGVIGAGAVLHHHALVELGRERLGKTPGGEVGAAAGRDRHDHLHGPCRERDRKSTRLNSSH